MNTEYDIELNKNRITEKFNKLSFIEDIELKADLYKYLCIIISGHYEQSVKALFLAYIAEQSNGKLTDFFYQRVLRYKHNLKLTELSTLLSDLDKSFVFNYSKEEKQTIGDKIANLVNSRNILAHGNNTDLAVNMLKDYFNTTDTLIKKLESMLNPEKH